MLLRWQLLYLEGLIKNRDMNLIAHPTLSQISSLKISRSTATKLKRFSVHGFRGSETVKRLVGKHWAFHPVCELGTPTFWVDISSRFSPWELHIKTSAVRGKAISLSHWWQTESCHLGHVSRFSWHGHASADSATPLPTCSNKAGDPVPYSYYSVTVSISTNFQDSLFLPYLSEVGEHNYTHFIRLWKKAKTKCIMQSLNTEQPKKLEKESK